MHLASAHWALVEPHQIGFAEHLAHRPLQYFTGKSGSLSPLFNLQLPPENLFGADATAIPELLLSPSAEQGYYLFVQPLHRGKHTIRWVATGCQPSGSQDIIWHLRVVH